MSVNIYQLIYKKYDIDYDPLAYSAFTIRISHSFSDHLDNFLLHHFVFLYS